MKNLIFIFIGGGLGSIVRYSLGKWVDHFHQYAFPLGTLVVNMVACFVLGLVIGLADSRQLMSTSAKLFWTVGFCGGFSTFSTFSGETMVLVQTGLSLNAIAYVVFSLGLCIGATYVGVYSGEHLG